jgi:hypothetical protein
MGKKPMIALDLSVTMLATEQAELRVINSVRAFLNFFLDRAAPPALNFFNKKVYHSLVHHLA